MLEALHDLLQMKSSRNGMNNGKKRLFVCRMIRLRFLWFMLVLMAGFSMIMVDYMGTIFLSPFHRSKTLDDDMFLPRKPALIAARQSRKEPSALALFFQKQNQQQQQQQQKVDETLLSQFVRQEFKQFTKQWAKHGNELYTKWQRRQERIKQRQRAKEKQKREYQNRNPFLRPPPPPQPIDNNNNNKRRPKPNVLEFVHITKTGGTAIEKAAAKMGIYWGICQYEYRPELLCAGFPQQNDPQINPDHHQQNIYNDESEAQPREPLLQRRSLLQLDDDWNEEFESRKRPRRRRRRRPTRKRKKKKRIRGRLRRPLWNFVQARSRRIKKIQVNQDLENEPLLPLPPLVFFQGEKWHTPPSWQTQPNPYSVANATFAVVRNPYDRIISEYYCKFFGFHHGGDAGTRRKRQSPPWKPPQRQQEQQGQQQPQPQRESTFSWIWSSLFGSKQQQTANRNTRRRPVKKGRKRIPSLSPKQKRRENDADHERAVAQFEKEARAAIAELRRQEDEEASRNNDFEEDEEENEEEEEESDDDDVIIGGYHNRREEYERKFEQDETNGDDEIDDDGEDEDDDDGEDDNEEEDEEQEEGTDELVGDDAVNDGDLDEPRARRRMRQQRRSRYNDEYEYERKERRRLQETFFENQERRRRPRRLARKNQGDLSIRDVISNKRSRKKALSQKALALQIALADEQSGEQYQSRPLPRRRQRPRRPPRPRQVDTPETLNNWIQKKLVEPQRVFHSGHVMPQVYFTHDFTTGQQQVTHILRFETLNQDFNALMKQYQLPITLDEAPVNRGHFNTVSGAETKESSSQGRFTAKDLTPKTIAMLNEFYAVDFMAFGYPMIQPKQ